MKFIISRSDLLKAVERTDSSAPGKTTIPILEHTLVVAKGNRVSFTTTNLDMTITATAPAEVPSEGAAVVPTDMLRDIARKSPDGCQIGVDTDERTATVRAGRGHYKLALLDPKDFPTWRAKTTTTISMSAGDLRDMLDRVRFATAGDPKSRAYLAGVYLERSRDMLRAAATDSHRLALTEIPAPAGTDKMPGIIIPNETVDAIRKVVPDGMIKLSLGEDVIEIEAEDEGESLILRSKLIAGTYPDYERVIPHNHPLTVLLDADRFLALVERVSLVSNDRDRSIGLAFSATSVTAFARNAEDGREAEEEMEVDGPKRPITIGFNSRYLIEHVGKLDADVIEMTLDGPASPAILRASGRVGHLHVLMPLRVTALTRSEAA